jgi:hypothetical protein
MRLNALVVAVQDSRIACSSSELSSSEAMETRMRSTAKQLLFTLPKGALPEDREASRRSGQEGQAITEAL